MKHVFPKPIRNLPKADIPLEGLTAYMSQAEDHQILYMQFENDAELKEHSHADQSGFVLEGSIDFIIDGEKHSYTKGDRYHIPEGVKHSGFIHAGYADITVFMEPGRYQVKE